MDNVVSHARFKLDPSGVEHLRSMGVQILSDFPSEEELGLVPPDTANGEQVLGTLTDDEFSVFVGIWNTQAELANIGKAITSRKLHEAAEKALTSESPQAFIEDVRSGMTGMIWSDEEEAALSFQLQAKLTFLKGLLYWTLGERFNCHQFKTGVRTGRRFVTKERRY